MISSLTKAHEEGAATQVGEVSELVPNRSQPSSLDFNLNQTNCTRNVETGSLYKTRFDHQCELIMTAQIAFREYRPSLLCEGSVITKPWDG